MQSLGGRRGKECLILEKSISAEKLLKKSGLDRSRVQRISLCGQCDFEGRFGGREPSSVDGLFGTVRLTVVLLRITIRNNARSKKLRI